MDAVLTHIICHVMVGRHQGFLLTVTVMSIVIVVVTAVLMLMPLDAILTQMVSIVSHNVYTFLLFFTLSPPLPLSLSKIISP